MSNPTEEDISARRQAMSGPLEEIAGYIPEAFPQGSEEPVTVGCYYCDQPIDAETAEHWINDSYPCCDECFEREIDSGIYKIINDDSPVTAADRAAILECQLGITKGKNHLLSASLEKALQVMRSYKAMGHGDDVHMSALCDAIRHAERALEHFVIEEKREAAPIERDAIAAWSAS